MNRIFNYKKIRVKRLPFKVTNGYLAKRAGYRVPFIRHTFSKNIAFACDRKRNVSLTGILKGERFSGNSYDNFVPGG